MNYFCKKSHCDTWINNMGIDDKDIMPVDIRTGLSIGKAIFAE